jgi:hypothetical protein
MAMQVNTLQPYGPFRFQCATFREIDSEAAFALEAKQGIQKIVPAKSRVEISPFGSLDRLFSMKSPRNLFQTGPSSSI